MTVEEVESALKSAGFSKVKADHHKSKPWITVVARTWGKEMTTQYRTTISDKRWIAYDIPGNGFFAGLGH